MSNKPLHPRTEFVVVLLGGLGLAAAAGFVNSVVIALGTLPVTHLTGTVTRLSLDLGAGDRADAVFVTGLVLSFVFGAAMSGMIIGRATLRLGRRYGVAVMVEAALIGLSAATISSSLPVGALLAATAAGLQNAMASSYRSMIIRTTHVTGLLTDLGFMTGQLLAGHKVGGWRLLLLTGLLTSFVAGGITGVVAQHRLGHAALWIPAAGMALGGTCYFAWRLRLGSAVRSTPPPRMGTSTPASPESAALDGGARENRESSGTPENSLRRAPIFRQVPESDAPPAWGRALSDLFEIIYVSIRSPKVTDAEVVDKIVLPAGRTNRQLDITGCLWFDRERFLQVLEGPRANVEMIYAKIVEDPRHSEIVLLSASPLAARSFDRWSMRSVTGESKETIKDLAGHFGSGAKKTPKPRAETDTLKHLADRLRARMVRLVRIEPYPVIDS